MDPMVPHNHGNHGSWICKYTHNNQLHPRKLTWRAPNDGLEKVTGPFNMAIVGIYVGVSKNNGTPKWMVKIMENPIKIDDLEVPLFLETSTYR